MRTITCNCGGNFPASTGATSAAGGQPMRSHPRCPSCGAKWIHDPETGRSWRDTRDYVTGCERTKTVVSKAIRAGRRARRDEFGVPPYHAVPLDQVVDVDVVDREAVCGATCAFIDTARPWKHAFAASADWCPRCVELVPR